MNYYVIRFDEYGKGTMSRVLGEMIRELRHQCKMTGIELARKTGLSQSKISKIETGKCQNLQFREISALLNILGASDTVRQQAQAIFERVKPSYIAGQKYEVPFYTGYFELEKQTKHLRIFMICGIPALLQTLEYRDRVLQEYGQFREGESREAIMRETLKRQDLLWDKRYTFHFILHQTALYSAPASQSIQLTQLDRLVRFVDMPNIKLGIIPFEAGLPVTENTTLALYDDVYVTKTVASRETSSKEPHDVALYTKVFVDLDRRALYYDEARALIHQAIEYFN